MYDSGCQIYCIDMYDSGCQIYCIDMYDSGCQIYCTDMYDSGCQIYCNWSRLQPDLCVSTPKYHAADKHDTLPSQFKLTLGQPALSWALNGERYPEKQQVPIFQHFHTLPTWLPRRPFNARIWKL